MNPFKNSAPLAPLVSRHLLALLGRLVQLLDDWVRLHLVLGDPLEERVLRDVLRHPLEEIVDIGDCVNFASLPKLST